MLWQKHGYYPRINRGVHRKAANRVGTPALVCHLGIWRHPATWTIGPPAGGPTSDKTAQDYIEALRRRLSAQSDIISYDDYGVLHTNIIGMQGVMRGNIATFIFRWHRIFTTVRIEIHTEYITITSCLDASLQPTLDSDQTLDSVSDPVFKNIRSLFQSLNAGLSKRDTTANYSDLSTELYQTIWDRFETEILNNRDANGEQLGGIFADFRGVVTSEPFPEREYEDPRYPNTRAFFGKPFRVPKRIRPDYHRNDFPPKSGIDEQDWARSRVIGFWPFIECSKEFSEVEFSVSTFLEGRALYASSLGPVGVDVDISRWHDPVRFFIHSYTDDRWQIGRLVDRILQAGTARLATVIELDALHAAGAKLDKLEGSIRNTRSEIHNALTGIAGGQITPQVTQNQISDLFNESQRLFADLNNDFMAKSIEYRTDRSVYYLDQFDIAVKALRIERIEGYQPYHEYVARRLGGSFSHIKMMQSRVREAKEDMTSLYQYFVSENIANVATSIRKRDDSIQEIQDFGEIILLLVFLPYYLGYLFIHNLVPAPQAFWWQLAFFVGAAITAGRVILNLYGDLKERNFKTKGFATQKRLMIILLVFLIGVTVASGSSVVAHWLRGEVAMSLPDHPDQDVSGEKHPPPHLGK